MKKYPKKRKKCALRCKSGFSMDTGIFILATIIIDLIAAGSFYLGKWKL